MKKLINYLIIIFLIVYYITFYLPRLNKLTFVMKHLSLYIVMALIAFKIIEYYYGKLIKKTEQDTFQGLIGIMKVFVFGIVLLIIASFQFNYIERKETLIVQGCKFYDSNNNMLYQSLYSGKCPQLQIEENTSNRISFTVDESRNRYFNEFMLNGQWVDPLEVPEYETDIVIWYLPKVTIQFNSKTDMDIEYDDQGRIIDVKLFNSELLEITDQEDEITYYYRSYYRDISNTYGADSFESIDLYGETRDRNYEPNSNGEVVHYVFNDDELKTTRLYTEKATGNETMSIFSETEVDGVLTPHLLANASIDDQTNETKITIDIKDEQYGIKASNVLSIQENQITLDLLEMVGNKTITNHTSWENIREFDKVIKEKSVINNFNNTERNHDFDRYYDTFRDTVILESYRIYELDHESNLNVVTLYEETDLPLFGQDKKRNDYPYYDRLKPNQYFNYEFRLSHSSSAGDVFHQELPFFHQYYK